MNQRYFARVAVTFLARTQSTALLTDYVTATGVFVRTDAPPQPMELLRIEFRSLPPQATTVALHGMVTRYVPPSTKHAAPGVEIAFFAKGGEASGAWDAFIAHLCEVHPESRSRPVMLAPGTTDQVRRAHPRLVPTASFPIEAEGADSLTVGDISDGGMFILTDDDSFVIGSDLRITLTHPRTSERINVDCVVRRRTSGATRGIGVEFGNMDDRQRRVLRDLMRAAGATHAVYAHSEEILIPSAPPRRKRDTLPGPASSDDSAWRSPTEDSWVGLDHHHHHQKSA